MITDKQTNFLYLADTLPQKYPFFYERFANLLKELNIDFALLPDTKDVWAVDYMPIQIEKEKFVRFTYTPSYLLKEKKYLKTISDTDKICADIGVNTLKSEIIIDGGNVIRANEKVIMTDRIFSENPTFERKQLIKKLIQLFEVSNIFFIPEQPDDFTGHADGIVRFVDNNTLIISDFKDEDESFQNAFEDALHNAGLQYVKVPYNVKGNKGDDAKGIYINYLQVGQTIIVPTFGLKEDETAIRQFERLFPNCKVVSIDSTEIAKDGGILNCISWNIQK